VIRLFAAASSALAVACASACGGAVPAGPPEIQLGIDACDGCGMVIAEPRYAAAAVADDGALRRGLKFDDIGCLARWEANASRSKLRERWVHDRSSGEWIDVSAATFVQNPELSTPMGSGLSAFKNRSDADVLSAERGAQPLSWSAILNRARDGSLQVRPLSRVDGAR
jgi:copper chaperone NosL